VSGARLLVGLVYELGRNWPKNCLVYGRGADYFDFSSICQ
jgi:hypothetical protein